MQSNRYKKTKLEKLLWAILLYLCISMPIPCQAFEDCMISTDGKLSDISIEHNDIIDVYPIFTIMNEKNTLFVHPLKTGKTRFCVLKNGKQKVMFNVEVTEEGTTIGEVAGFEILVLDIPSDVEEAELMRDLPMPPMLRD